MVQGAIAVADHVEILVLVDNVTDNLSSVPSEVENEWPRLRKRGMRAVVGNMPVLRRAWAVLRRHRLARRHVAYPSFRYRPRGVRFRAQRRAPRVRHGDRGRHRAVARPLGSLRRYAARARHDPEPGTADARCQPTCTPTCTEAVRSNSRTGPCGPFEDVPTAAMLETARRSRRTVQRGAAGSRRPVLPQRRDPASDVLRDRFARPLSPHGGRVRLGGRSSHHGRALRGRAREGQGLSSRSPPVRTRAS